MKGRRSLLLGVAVVFGAAILCGVLAYNLVGPVQYRVSAPLEPVTPSTSEVVPSTTESAAPPPPPDYRHEPVAQAMPTELTIWKEGERPLLGPSAPGVPNLDPNPAVMRPEHNNSVLPNTLELPAVQNDPHLDWAVLPGTGVGTTVIVCHTIAEADPPLPCNALTSISPDSDASSGYMAELVLPTGRLTSRLTDVHQPLKEETKDLELLFTKERDRWLVVMCDLERDPVTDKLRNTAVSRILEFHLIESVSFS